MKALIYLCLMCLFTTVDTDNLDSICDKYTTVKTNNITGESVAMSKESLKIADSGRKMVFEMSFIKEDGEINYLFTSNKPLIVEKNTKVKIKFQDGTSVKIRTANKDNNSSGLLNIKMGEKSGNKKQLKKISSKKIDVIEFKTGEQEYKLDFGGFHKNYVLNTLDCLIAK